MYLDEDDVGYLDVVLETYLGNPFLELSDEERKAMDASDAEAHDAHIVCVRELKTRTEMFLYNEKGYEYPESWNDRQKALYDVLMRDMPEDDFMQLVNQVTEVVDHYCNEETSNEG